ncbi:MAG: hypothetical protein ACQCN3_12375 [Candidatus Bathyarchaeia archaeon]
MGVTLKLLSLLFILTFTASSVLLVDSVFASSKPSVPEFTLAYDTHSSDKPAIYDIDPYTGEQRMLSPAVHREWQTINVTIKNQPFSPYKELIGNSSVDINLFYGVKFKGAFEEDWHDFGPDNYVIQKETGQYTVITFFVGLTGPYGYSTPGRSLNQISPTKGGQVDFQVKALVGYVTPGYESMTIIRTWISGTFNGTESGWSNTQTINVPPYSQNPSATSIVNPNSPLNQQKSEQINFSLNFGDFTSLFSIICIALIVVVVVIVSIIVLLVKLSGKQTINQPNPT